MTNISQTALLVIMAAGLLGAVEILERKVKDESGEAYDVTEIIDGDTDIILMKKDGETVEQQIIHQDKSYITVKHNGTCSIEFHDEEEDETKQCFTGTIPDLDEVSGEIKKECGDLQIVFVRPSECEKEGEIQKRWIRYPCRYYYYWSVSCSWWCPRRCWIILRRVYRCGW